jgi:hypothetical protein
MALGIKPGAFAISMNFCFTKIVNVDRLFIKMSNDGNCLIYKAMVVSEE